MLDEEAIAQLDADALDAEIIRAGNAEEPKAYRRALTAAYDIKRAEENAARLAATLSDADKSALLQQIAPDGIATAETVGTPGKET